MEDSFELEKYMGKWYGLCHYPDTFEGSDTYNTTSKYKIVDDDTVSMKKCTYTAGRKYSNTGEAKILDEGILQVRYTKQEIENLEYISDTPTEQSISDDYANYIVKYIYEDDGVYTYAVVTDEDKKVVWLLSRTPTPSKEVYDSMMQKLAEEFDMTRITQTPHY